MSGLRRPRSYAAPRAEALALASYFLCVTASLPPLGCGACDPESECSDKNGVASSSADVGGANDSICGHAASTGTFDSNGKTSKDYDWEAVEDGKQWTCSCSDEGGTLAKCSFSQP